MKPIVLIDSAADARFTFGKRRVFHYVDGLGLVELTDEEIAELEKRLSPDGQLQVVAIDVDAGVVTVARVS